jgi:hypothetical protein
MVRDRNLINNLKFKIMFTSKFKGVAIGLTLLSGALFIDANNYLPVQEANTSEARFLGTGVKTEVGPCLTVGDKSFRVVTKSFTVFGIQCGDTWPGDSEPC